MRRRAQEPLPWRFVAPLLLSLLGLSAPAAGEGRPVRVGLYQNEPKIFIDGSGRAAGVFVDILAEVAREEGWTVEFVECEWSECLRALEEGRIDLMPDVAYSRERDERYDFHRHPVIESWSQLYARPGLQLESLADVDGRRIALLEDSIQQADFEEMTRGFGHAVEVVPTRSLEQAFRLVADGGADAAVANHLFGDRFYRDFGLAKTPVVFMAANLHFAVAKGRNADLLGAMDRHLAVWRRQSSSPYYMVLAKWMGRPPVEGFPRRFVWVAVLAAAALVLALGLVLLLRSQVRARTRHLAAANEELRRAQQALDEERRQLLSVFDSIDQAIYIVDPRTYEVLFVNRHLREMLGRDPIGGKCHEEFQGFPAPCPFCTNEIIIANGGQPYTWEYHNLNLDRDYWLIDRIIRWPDGRDVRFEMALDITERKRVEREKEALAEELRHSQKMEAIGSLAGGIAHDFNNLLTVINGHARFAAGALSRADPVRIDLERILQAGWRAASLTRQLLAFSRKQALEPRIVDLNEIIRGLEELLVRLLGEHIRVRLELTDGLWPVAADPGKVEQVVMNLAVNARDAMPKGGDLEVHTKNVEVGEEDLARHGAAAPGAYVAVTVSDTGCGMDEATRARAFDPFFTTKEAGKGTGLGLSMVYGIVTQSGGHVRVTSEPGRGSSFEMLFPRVAGVADEGQIAPAGHRESSGAGGGEAILLAEDEDTVRSLVERVLRMGGYRVLAAANGEAAVELSGGHAGEIRLLLTDLVMPGMGGRDLAERLVADRPGLRVLFMSGWADGAGGREALGPGARFVGKPFSADELLRAVREALDG
jgi:signal transduction histidine kinase/ABC-type amino acid transport substrate-binding protein/CheY-like chemotaxis protein